MKTLAMTLDLKDDPEAIAAYRRHHAAVWPEVIQSLQKVGVKNMRIWLRQRRLFMLVEAEVGFEPSSRYRTVWRARSG